MPQTFFTRPIKANLSYIPVFDYQVMSVCKVTFNKKKDFEYTYTSTVDITRLELVQEVKKKKVRADDSPLVDFGSTDLWCQPTHS